MPCWLVNGNIDKCICAFSNSFPYYKVVRPILCNFTLYLNVRKQRYRKLAFFTFFCIFDLFLWTLRFIFNTALYWSDIICSKRSFICCYLIIIDYSTWQLLLIHWSFILFFLFMYLIWIFWIGVILNFFNILWSFIVKSSIKSLISTLR